SNPSSPPQAARPSGVPPYGTGLAESSSATRSRPSQLARSQPPHPSAASRRVAGTRDDVTKNPNNRAELFESPSRLIDGRNWPAVITVVGSVEQGRDSLRHLL